MDIPDRPVSARRLRQLHCAGVLDADAYEWALAYAGITPTAVAWRRFLDWLLAGLGTVLMLSGIIFFFAYNWADLHPFAKFAVLEIALLIAVALAWRLHPDSHGGRAALLGASVLPGVLLALYGQTYQTGADPYGLFLVWAGLILPWVIMGRSAALWFLLLVLTNLALILWWTGVHRPPEWLGFAQEIVPLFGVGFVFVDADLALLVVTLNLAALLACEVMAPRFDWLSGRWMPRVIALAALAVLLVPVLRAIFNPSLNIPTLRLAPVGWLVIIGLGMWTYLSIRRDLLILAALSFDVIIVMTAFLGDQMVSGGGGAGALLFLSLIVLAMSAAATYWLRHIAQQWGEEG